MALPADPLVVHPPIYVIRDRQIILDSDLALLFGVSTKRLGEQIRRNQDRFPADFVFRLTTEEANSLRSQFATSKKGNGAVMAANVLNSPRAVAMSVEVVRAFVRLRKVTLSHDSLKAKLSQLEEAVKTKLDSHDAQIEELFDTVESLIEGNVGLSSSKKQIGFAP